jgi:hypothetical protein
MSTMIRVRDFLNNPMAVSTDKAELVFIESRNAIEKGEKVEFNFEDIKLVITAFLNIAIGKLYGLNIDYKDIDERLDYSNSTPAIKNMIEKVILNSKKFYSNRSDGEKNNNYLNRSIDGDI